MPETLDQALSLQAERELHDRIRLLLDFVGTERACPVIGCDTPGRYWLVPGSDALGIFEQRVVTEEGVVHARLRSPYPYTQHFTGQD